MVQKISRRFRAWAKGWLVVVLAALNGFFLVFIMPLIEGMMKGRGGAQVLMDLKFFYTPHWAYEMMGTYGGYGRAFYRSMELTVDLVFPLVYALAFGLLISWLFQRGFRSDSKMQKWNVTPIGAWLFDLLENLGVVALLTAYPSQLTPVAWLTTVFTMVKWTFVGLSILLMVIGLAAAAKNGFRKQA